MLQLGAWVNRLPFSSSAAGARLVPIALQEVASATQLHQALTLPFLGALWNNTHMRRQASSAAPSTSQRALIVDTSAAKVVSPACARHSSSSCH